MLTSYREARIFNHIVNPTSHDLNRKLSTRPLNPTPKTYCRIAVTGLFSKQQTSNGKTNS